MTVAPRGAVEVGPPSDDGEILAYGEAARTSLPFGSMTAKAWTERQPADQMRLARVDGQVAGGGLLCPMAQYFGGRPVPMIGLNAVAVAPEYRGRGVGSRLMGAIVDEIAGQGVALSCLYPATQPIYRSVGYEQAGARALYRVPITAIEHRSRDLVVDRIDMSDLDDVRPLHESRARWRPGNLARSDWAWSRLLDPPYPDGLAFRVRQDGLSTGYVIARQQMEPRARGGRVAVRDFCATTPEAAARLWTVLADHRSMCHEVVVPGDLAAEPLLGFREQLDEVCETLRWMVRITNLRSALMSRGYPKGLTAELGLEVSDDRILLNRGRFTLHIANGMGRVTASASKGAGGLELDIAALAPIYTGHIDPRLLAESGRVRGDDESLADAAAIFAGPAPSMIDFF